MEVAARNAAPIPVTRYSMQVAALKEFRDLCYNMINCPKPKVSAIHGAVVGAGLAAALLAGVIGPSMRCSYPPGSWCGIHRDRCQEPYSRLDCVQS